MTFKVGKLYELRMGSRKAYLCTADRKTEYILEPGGVILCIEDLGQAVHGYPYYVWKFLCPDGKVYHGKIVMDDEEYNEEIKGMFREIQI